MMKVKAKTGFFYGKQLCKKGDVIEIKPSEFNGINMVQVEEEEKVEEVKPAKTYTRKTTTKKTSNKKSK